MDLSQLGSLSSRLGSILRRPLYLISVRARIAALALIPVVGFAIVGLAYLAGEQEIEAAFESVKTSGALADASHDFKSAISTMRISAKEFATSPNQKLFMLPMEVTGVLGSLAGIAELAKDSLGKASTPAPPVAKPRLES